MEEIGRKESIVSQEPERTLFENCLQSLKSTFISLEMLGNSPNHPVQVTENLAIYGNNCTNLICSDLTNEQRAELFELLSDHHRRAAKSEIVNLKTVDLGTTMLLETLGIKAE